MVEDPKSAARNAATQQLQPGVVAGQGVGAASDYMPQLDTVRTFAVGMVILHHWWEQNAFLQRLNFGAVGVTVFFVLSGFLITRLLLVGKDAAPDSATGRRSVLGRFYARRALRIFPAYYLLLLILYLAAEPGFREHVWWFLLYAGNVLFYQTQTWPGQTTHLWTLAVEEQFYLLWPVLLLFSPRRFLLRIILAAILVGIVFRLWLLLASDGGSKSAEFIGLLMPSCMDSFGLGALLAYARARIDERYLFDSWPWRLLLVACAVFLLLVHDTGYLLGDVLYPFAVSVLALELVARASLGFTGLAGLVMENRVLVYLGRISYGLYLFHLAVPKLYAWIGLPSFARPLTMAIQFCLLVAVAALSWHVFEKPINAMKHRFALA